MEPVELIWWGLFGGIGAVLFLQITGLETLFTRSNGAQVRDLEARLADLENKVQELESAAR